MEGEIFSMTQTYQSPDHLAELLYTTLHEAKLVIYNGVCWLLARGYKSEFVAEANHLSSGKKSA